MTSLALPSPLREQHRRHSEGTACRLHRCRRSPAGRGDGALRAAPVVDLAVARSHDRLGLDAVGESDVVADFVGDDGLEIGAGAGFVERETPRTAVDLDVRVLDETGLRSEGVVRLRERLVDAVVRPSEIAEVDGEGLFAARLRLERLLFHHVFVFDEAQ
jgi:hypothetical protein